MAKGKSIGKVGKFRAKRKLRGEWDSKIWLGLMKLCWLNKFGDYKLKSSPYYTRYSAPSISPQAQFLKQKAPRVRLLGKACLKLGMLLKKE